MPMKAKLTIYANEEIESEEIIDLPNNYDGDPYGDTLPFCMTSNWQLFIIED